MKIGVDIGGTFTDLVLLDEATGRLYNEKVLTTPDDPSRGVLTGIRLVLENNGIAPGQVDHVIHGTTLVANALIERKGARTALVTTQGFRDVLQISREWRYDTYDLFLSNVEPLVRRSLRFEVAERIGPGGEVVLPLDPASLDTVAEALARSGVEAVAVCLLHAFKNPAHEQQVKAHLQARLPGVTLCISSEVMPEIGEYERSSTTVANAYVQPLFSLYIRRLSDGIKAMGIRRDLFLMQSDGGTVHERTAAEYPIRLVQSGPAGGVQTASLIGRITGRPDVLCFDMGGTTAKAALIEAGEPSRTTDFEVARVYRFKRGSGLPLKVPVIDMIEIGAGGGSIARVNRLGLLQVGPDSSSAVPGPACYGQGGTDATVTDADLVLGYLAPDSFLGGDMALHVDAARAAIEATIARPLGLSVVEAAWGIHDTVNESMSQAAGIHVLEKGLRSEDFVMTPIGGAGPVHACHVARKMGMRQVVCPAGAGVASAFGFLAAPTSFEFVQSSMEPLDTLDLTAAKALLDDLTARGHALLQDSGLDRSVFSVRLGCAMRYVGQGYEVNVALPDALFAAGDKAALLRAFETAYNALYGRTEAGFRTEIVSWRVVVASPLQEPPLPVAQDAGTDITVALKGHRDVFDGTTMGFVSTPVYDRYRLGEGMRARGPLVVEERESTFVVPAGSEMAVDGHGNLIVTFDAAPE